MTRLVAPVHIARIGKTAVRFFRPPNGRLEKPWVAINDVCNAMRLSPDRKRELLLKAGEALIVSTSAGPVAVHPHEAAQSIITAVIDRSLTSAFDGAVDTANAKMMAGMSSGEVFDSMIRSARAVERAAVPK